MQEYRRLELESIGTVNNYREYEVARNKEILSQLVKDNTTLARILDMLDNGNLLEHSDRVMIERLKTSLSCGVDCRGVVERLAEIGKKSPTLFSLFVSLAVYRYYDRG